MVHNSHHPPCLPLLEHTFIDRTGKSVEKLKDFYTSLSSLNNQVIKDVHRTSLSKPDALRAIVYKYQQKRMDLFLDFYAEKNLPFPLIHTEEIIRKTEEYIASFPAKVIKQQDAARFRSLEGDSAYISFIKFHKRIFLGITRVPHAIANGVRRIFRKKPSVKYYWKYSIPMNDIASYVAYQHLLAGLKEIVWRFNENCLRITKSVIESDQALTNALLQLFGQDKPSFDYSETARSATSEIDAIFLTLKNECSELTLACDDKIVTLSSVAGTLELPALRLRWKNSIKKKVKVRQGLEHQLINWGNTMFALVEDWKIDQEIYWNKVKTEKAVAELNQSIIEKHQVIVEQLNIVRQQINQRKKEIYDKLQKQEKDHVTLLNKTLEELNTNVAKLKLFQTVEQLVSYNLPSKINDLELTIIGEINTLSEKRWLTRDTSYLQPVKSTDLSSFSLQELLRVGCFPNLNEQAAKLKLQSVSEIEKLHNEIHNIKNVLEFNLSALIQPDEIGLIKAESIPELFNEGMDRSISRISDIAADVTKFSNNTVESLNKIIADFNTKTLELTKSESAFELRLIVMKAKALKKTEEFSLRIWVLTKVKFLQFVKKSREVIVQFNSFITPWRRRVGLGGAAKGNISSELSDFLSEAYQRINKLPVIYQRLYRIQPLTELSFFIGREEEIKQLNIAYESHKESKFAPSVIVGEKWCGHTTLINYFKIQHSFDKSNTITGILTRNTVSENEFYAFWQELLQNTKIASLEQLTELIVAEHSGKVIIVENLHNFYLRTIHGFENLYLLAKLIAATYKQVFWLFTANNFAWEYLSKTIEIEGYFAYVINMSPYNDKQLRELIMKKNSVSGYRINFLQSESHSSNKKFLALEESQKQDLLRNEFFKDLNTYAKGNISLCLSYWLLSTGKINENTIEIVKFTPPDLSFIKQLSADKVFILFLLIMHDGLTLEQLGVVYKKTIDKIQLMVLMLLDDGVLIDRNSWFEVNPLIYRQSIDMLKSKNLID
ncbi:MAG: hypothetical protein U5K79_08855 [Cyclobacteriaceae bacterium]|nr:hypothetical protein [Cyclobacteriaceae bacterium]